MADKKKTSSASSEAVQARPSSSDGEAAPAKQTKAVSRQRESRQEVRREKRPSPFARLLNIRLVRFVYDAYYELRYKVTWPTVEEARNMTIAVILLSVSVGIILGVADAGLFQLFRLVTGTGR
jgi:preprotein translocase SecE subunit